MYQKNPLITENYNQEDILKESVIQEQLVQELLAVGSKLAKQIIIQNKIIAKYPEPDQLRIKLAELGKHNSRCAKLAQEMPSGMDNVQYRKWVRVHFAGGTFLSWIANILLTPTGIPYIYQPASAIVNATSDADSILDRRARV